MFFLNPVWFFGFAALSVPLAIHLWNTKRGKTLRIGSIAWIKTGNRQNRRSRRITELLLLLFRCLLLTLVIISLAKPILQQKNAGGTAKGWILTEPGELRSAYAAHNSTFNSLLKKGFEYHQLEPGFPKADFEKALASKKKSAKIGSYWPLLRRLETAVPGNFPIVLITGKELKNFRTRRPASALNLQWLTFPKPDTAVKKTEKIWLDDAGNTRTATLTSTPAGNTYTFSAAKISPAGVRPDTSRLKIGIVADNRSDANYLRAALAAIRNFTGRRIEIEKTPGANTDWLFWLSGKPVPGSLRQKHLFRYASGSAISAPDQFRLPSSSGSIALNRIIDEKKIGTVLWRTDAGKPVLQRFETGNQNVFVLYTHFDPAWSSLVWHPDFAASLLTLLYPQDKNIVSDDHRTIDPQQLMPEKSSAANTRKADFTTEKKDLKTPLWIILVLVLILERFFSHYKKKGVPA